MKIIFLAPGLPRIKRGYERFVLELAAELRKSGLDAICWGTGEAPGIEELPVPGRLEFQNQAFDRLRADARFSSLPPNSLQDWSTYTEDQLFAIPAAHKVKRLLDSGESLLVYARWQGGLVDASGAPTDLLKTLASAKRKGNAQLLIHADYFCAPIHSLLWNAGASFHALGSWISEPLQQLGVLSGSIAELPMCIRSSDYRQVSDYREAARHELGIPPNAFVILSVGSFDTTTPDKRHGYLLREIIDLRDSADICWVVVGSRGPHPVEWEEEARQTLGSRFIPLTNLDFEKMPRVYSAADLFALASTEETFGLVYAEAQIAGLPTVVHNTNISREIYGGISEEKAAMCLIDMNRPGAASGAIARWRNLLCDPHERTAIRLWLDAFADSQARRFGWEFTTARFVETLQQLSSSSASTGVADRRIVGAWDEQFHRQALKHFEQKRYSDAALVLARSLAARETAERWNDWAVVQLALGNNGDAEQGFRRALVLDPRHTQATANLGALLATSDRSSEAIPFLESGLSAIDQGQRPRLASLLKLCQANAGVARLPTDEDLSQFIRGLVRDDRNGGLIEETVRYCLALLKFLPQASSEEHLLGIGRFGTIISALIARFKSNSKIRWCDPEKRVAKADNFDLDVVPWPLESASISTVILSQALQLLSDPMQALAEINRILRPDGLLVLTVPNLASTKSMQSLLRGESPYVAGRLSSAANVHMYHREYTPCEVEAVMAAAGFGNVITRTQDLVWESSIDLSSNFAVAGFKLAARGDTILSLARKQADIRDRFPVKLYDVPKYSSAKPLLESATFAPSEPPLRILVVYETLPFSDRGGADHRLMQIIRLLREQGHLVTFLSPRGCGKESYAAQLREIGVEVRIEDAQLLQREGIEISPGWTLQEVLREGQFDLAILSLWFWMGISLPEHYMDEIRRLSPSTRIAILTDDCHGLRESGMAKLSGLWSDAERACDFGEREIEIHRRAELVISISPADQDRIRAQVPGTPVDLLPMMVEPQVGGLDFESREGLVYLANFNNPASLDGLEWYLREVAPLLREQLPSVKLHLVGAGLPDSWMTTDPNVIRVGPVPDLSRELTRRRIMVSPLRFGTGIKTKNLHALAYGLPIVTNAMGAEGLEFSHRETALISEDPREFAEHVVNLYTDASLWNRLSKNSSSHIRKHFSKETMDSALAAVLAGVRRVPPLAVDPAHIWSTRLVEKMFLEVLSYQPPKERPSIRILAYARAAEQLLAAGNFEEARRQLQHVFSFVPNRMSRTIFFGNFLTVAETMERVYRGLGETQGAAEFRREANRYAIGAFPEPSTSPRPQTNSQPPSAVVLKKSRPHGSDPTPDFSVIVPTYNRSAVLSECLAALERQSLSRRRFEVIVVDDGSTDATRDVCKGFEARYLLRYLKQENRGAGAARRFGVEEARGKYLLLINDDTVSHPDMFRSHLDALRAHSSEKVAILGDFKYPKRAKNRALTHFLDTQPFLFPQVTMRPGYYATNAFFVTCNLSILRETVLAVGSFDPAFRVAEDTELGIRLIRRGLKVLYVPQARAVHQHLDFTIPDLARRAQIYGQTAVKLYEKHPSLLEDGRGPFGTLDEKSLANVRSFTRERAAEVSAAVESLSRFDSVDFAPFFSKSFQGRSAADEVMDLFSRSVPIVFWFHVFRGFLNIWDGVPNSPPAPVAAGHHGLEEGAGL